MAITVNWAGATTALPTGALTQFTINVPTASVGDVVLVFAGSNNTNPTDGWDTHADFTQIMDQFDSVSDYECSVYWRKIDGTEGTTWTFTKNVAASRVIGCAVQVTGANNTAPIDFIASASNFPIDTTTVTIAAITTSQANCHAISVCGFYGTDVAPVDTSGSGWTERQELYGQSTSGNGGYPTLMLSDKPIPSAGSTLDNVHTTAIAARGTKFQLALAPTPDVGAPPTIGTTGGIVIPRPRLRMVGY